MGRIKAAAKWLFLLPRRIVSLPIKLYRRYLSPMKSSPSCRFTPTCSAYALEAIGEWGVIIGLFLAVRRVLRCNPFCRGGYDPVPKRRKKSDAPNEGKDKTDQ
ncbi:MAG: membrane protein insertion efficiency factor YidD [Clostridia bacterium]|nr:membrane protein insertion efficiency factor YidD [Clostridia bacterium]